jgi:CMP/dCMP kinase
MRIALSGLSGAGSSSTARLVSARLGLPMSNFTLRNLADEWGISFREIQAKAALDTAIDFELDRRLIAFIEQHPHCLISTDLACWLDSPLLQEKLGFKPTFTFDYRIWLDVPLDERARRIQKREGGELAEVKAYNHQRDMDNHTRYKKIYGVDILNHQGIDWIYETGDQPLTIVTDTICERVEQLLRA